MIRQIPGSLREREISRPNYEVNVFSTNKYRKKQNGKIKYSNNFFRQSAMFLQSPQIKTSTILYPGNDKRLSKGSRMLPCVEVKRK